MDRRAFLEKAGLGLTAAGLVGVSGAFSATAAGQRRQLPSELEADVAIIGGGVGGCAAALAALRSGRQVVMTEETSWIGGQLTQQAVPPDEHGWIEKFGGTRTYMDFRRKVREYYRQWYPLTGGARDRTHLDPGNCGVSRLCHEPRIALSVLEGMFAPYISAGRLTILAEHEALSADVSGDRVEMVRVKDRRSNDTIDLVAPYFVDATELGELLPLTGTEYVTGAESKDQTGELHAAPEPQPQNMQAMTWCFAMEYREGENHTIDRPDEYDFWRDYVPEIDPAWPGKQLNLTYSNPQTLEPRQLAFDPRRNTNTEGYNLWEYRRLADPNNFQTGTYHGGISLVNWPQNDYLLGNILEVSEEEAQKHRQRAMQLSKSLFYWLQTEAPRPDGGAGWPGLRLRGDITGTEHGLAKYPYIREARRIKAEFTVLEQHVGQEARMEATGLSEEEVYAEQFHDSVGVGYYRIDLHPSTGGDNYIDIASLPFQIPLGALIPQRMENLIPASKNIGTTHITNGCYRLHPVEWNIGESAGMLAAYALETDHPPRHIRSSSDVLGDFQRRLESEGVELAWPNPAQLPH